MRTVLLFSLIIAGSSGLFAQAPAGGTATPAQPPTTTRTTKPAPAPPAQPAATTQTTKPTDAPAQPPAKPTAKPAQAAGQPSGTSGRAPATTATTGRSGIALTVTDMRGITLPGVQVDVSGPAVRSGQTSDSGQVNFLTLPAGTYRMRFSGEGVTTFEREVTLAATKTDTLNVSLSPAPPPREIVREVPAPAPEPVKIPLGPSGTPQALSLYDLAEKELRAKQPRREILVACSGNLRSQIVFFTGKDDQPQRIYDGAESSYYVLGGEALITVGGKEHPLAAGGYVNIPRGVPFAIARRGNKALSLLSVLSGAPCEEAR